MRSEKIKIGTTAILKPFKFHDDVKQNLMHLINNAYSDTVNVKTAFCLTKLLL